MEGPWLARDPAKPTPKPPLSHAAGSTSGSVKASTFVVPSLVARRSQHASARSSRNEDAGDTHPPAHRVSGRSVSDSGSPLGGRPSSPLGVTTESLKELLASSSLGLSGQMPPGETPSTEPSTSASKKPAAPKAAKPAPRGSRSLRNLSPKIDYGMGHTERISLSGNDRLPPPSAHSPLASDPSAITGMNASDLDVTAMGGSPEVESRAPNGRGQGPSGEGARWVDKLRAEMGDEELAAKLKALRAVGGEVALTPSVRTSDSGSEADDGAPRQERVMVTVRVRPSSDTLKEKGGAVTILEGGKVMRVNRYLSLKSNIRYSDLAFDKLLGSQATQEDVYNAAARRVVEDVVKGYNGTIMAYGQTGAGKTYTVGNMLSTSGIIPRATSELFQIRDSDVDHEYTFYMSYVQIYCEQVQDLLNPRSANLQLREDENGLVVLAGVQEVEVRSIDESMKVLQVGERNRAYAFTKLNAHSSRSHAVVIVTVEKRPAREGGEGDPATHDVRTMKVGKLYLVDLAGSERLKKSASEGKRQDEAKAINRSLTTLGMCINAMAQNNPSVYVPFRDSKLTRLLQESLGGNAKTSLIVCVPDAAEHIEETMSSLQFGQRAMSVMTKARVNEVMDPMQFVGELEERINRAETAREMMQKALFSKQEQLEALRATVESEHSNQKQKMQLMVSKFKQMRKKLHEEHRARKEAQVAAERLLGQVTGLEASLQELRENGEALERTAGEARVERDEARRERDELREQLDEVTRKFAAGEDLTANLEKDVDLQRQSAKQTADELHRKDNALSEAQRRIEELLEANRVLRKVNAELEEQVQEGDAEATRLQEDLSGAESLAARRGDDISKLHAKIRQWQEADADRLRRGRAARKIQRAWSRFRLRKLVSTIAESQRAAREKEREIRDKDKLVHRARARNREFLLWAGAGLVQKSLHMVSEAAEAACNMMLLPEKDLRKHLQLKEKQLNAFAMGKGGAAGAGLGPSHQLLMTPGPHRGAQESLDGRSNSYGGHHVGYRASLSANGSPERLSGSTQELSHVGTPSQTRLLKTRTPMKGLGAIRDMFRTLSATPSRREGSEPGNHPSYGYGGEGQHRRAQTRMADGAQVLRPPGF